jgi:hypothetical protein
MFDFDHECFFRWREKHKDFGSMRSHTRDPLIILCKTDVRETGQRRTRASVYIAKAIPPSNILDVIFAVGFGSQEMPKENPVLLPTREQSPTVIVIFVVALNSLEVK